MFRRVFIAWALCLGPLVWDLGAAENALPSHKLQQLRSLLSNRCFACHGPDKEKREGGFRLDQGDSAYQAADSGKVPVVPGQPNQSEMLRRIVSDDVDERMPPASFGKPLEKQEVALIEEWLRSGAPPLKHWSFVPPTKPEAPDAIQLAKGSGKDVSHWLVHPIDRFVLQSQTAHGLAPSKPATPEVLLRRLSLDLTGLPPTRQQLEQFVADDRPDAIERAVDRLLASPEYGEHWARKWLDLARYADSAGYADDPPRTIWAYRDWVIRAINANLPLDEFTRMQLAGDLLPDPTEDDLVATAFHRNTLTNNEGGTNDEEFRNVAIVDRVNTTMAVWMGVTFNCAQCHTHKYDPFTQDEYFKLFDIFNQSQDADRRDESPTVEIFTADQVQRRAEAQKKSEQLREQLQQISPEVHAQFTAWSKAIQPPAWKPLKPKSFKARTNTEATWDDAGLIRVRTMQDKIVADTFTLEIDLPGQPDLPVRAISLRTVPLKDLPGGGAGFGGGNFVLTDVRANLIPQESGSKQARYVRVELPGKERMLSLAEVQVFSANTNLATKGKATQSSTDFGGEASRAIDGKTDGDYQKNSVTHTAVSDNPWWEVDLASQQEVDRLVIWNRTDNKLQSRLNGVEVTLLNEQRETVFKTTIKDAPKDSQAIAVGNATPLTWSAAFADYHQPDFAPAFVIDADKATGWAVGGQIESSHLLTLVPQTPVTVNAPTRLRLELGHDSAHRDHLLASFEILFSDDAKAVDWATMTARERAIVAMPEEQRSQADQQQLEQFFAQHLAPAGSAARTELAKLEKQLQAMKPETSVPIMRDLQTAQRRKTFVQLRGNYKSLGSQVHAGIPAIFAISSSTATRQTSTSASTSENKAETDAPQMNRLQLAEWLMARENPLTARVMANRYWEALFGLGIVRTSEEFGSQGDLPSHPELLDFLACELVDMQWDAKRFLRMIVLSQTYQQTSEVTPARLNADADNVWLARGPRVRLSAEMVRDQALATAGLLSHKMYGPPVRPPQPSLGLSAAFGSKTDWEASQGEDRYRRGVYTSWRRSNPYPSMATFDAPSREVCTLRRDSTNTPLQALVTLNDPNFVEAAQALARRILYVDGRQLNDRERLQLAFYEATSRQVTSRELATLERLLAEAKAQLIQQPKEAVKLATDPLGPLPEGTDPIDCAAWTAVGNVLLNLDEVLMKR